MTVAKSFSFIFLTLAVQLDAFAQPPKKLVIDEDVELHYVELGEGEPIIFIHGLLDDASAWNRQQLSFANEGFRAIAYSRRHNYPNSNPIREDHSAALEADDLAAFVRELQLRDVHVVGHSYGAYTALFFALNYPELVRTVSIVEPPLIPWLRDLDGPDREAGGKQYERLLQMGIEPARSALKSGDPNAAIRAMVDAIGGDGKYDSLPKFVKDKCLRNTSELRAFLASEDRYPAIDREQVRKLQIPTLILSGGKSLATARFTDPELERLIPKQFRRRVIFDDATHILWIEQPVRFRNEVLRHIRGQR